MTSIPHSTDSAQTLAARLRVILSCLHRRLREQATLGIPWPQMRVLILLEQYGPGTVSDLARAEGMRAQSMGETVAALRAAGLVDGAPDPNDGRRTLLTLTDACRTRIGAARAAREDWLCRALGERLSPAEQARLETSLDLLARLGAADDTTSRGERAWR